MWAAPCVGAIAERVDKRCGLFACDVCAATCVGGMLLLSIGLDQGRLGMDGEPSVLIWPAFFILVFLQQCFAAQYDPLRSSLVPQVCPGSFFFKSGFLHILHIEQVENFSLFRFFPVRFVRVFVRGFSSSPIAWDRRA